MLKRKSKRCGTLSLPCSKAEHFPTTGQASRWLAIQMAQYTERGLRMSLTRSNREILVGKIQRLVQEKFYDATFRGKDWSEVVASHRQRILEATTTEEFETEVQTMLTELDSPVLG